LALSGINCYDWNFRVNYVFVETANLLDSDGDFIPDIWENDILKTDAARADGGEFSNGTVFTNLELYYFYRAFFDGSYTIGSVPQSALSEQKILFIPPESEELISFANTESCPQPAYFYGDFYLGYYIAGEGADSDGDGIPDSWEENFFRSDPWCYDSDTTASHLFDLETGQALSNLELYLHLRRLYLGFDSLPANTNPAIISALAAANEAHESRVIARANANAGVSGGRPTTPLNGVNAGFSGNGKMRPERPFYAVVDLGALPVPESFPFFGKRLLLSEKNGWVATDGYFRWHNGAWAPLAGAESLSPMKHIVSDIGNDGAVLVGLSGSTGLNSPPDAPPVPSGGFYWNGAGAMVPAPSVDLNPFSWLPPRGMWGAKIIFGNAESAPLSVSTDYEWAYLIASGDGVPQPFYVHTGAPAAANFHKDVEAQAENGWHIHGGRHDFQWVSRTGSVLYKDDWIYSVPYSYVLKRNNCPIYYDSPEDYAKVRLFSDADEIYSFSLNCISREGFLVGSLGKENHVPVLVGKDAEKRVFAVELPPVADAVGFAGIPQFINTPHREQDKSFYTIASTQYVWWRVTDDETGMLTNNLAFEEPEHISELIDIGNNATTESGAPAVGSWKRNKWEITALNDDGLLAATGEKIGGDGTGTAHGALLVPCELIQGDPADANEEILTNETVTAGAFAVPELTIQSVSAIINGTDVVVNLSGTVIDKISKHAADASERLNLLDVYVNEKLKATFEIQGDVGTAGTYNGTLALQTPPAATLSIRVETRQNKSGLTAWAKCAVDVETVSSEDAEEKVVTKSVILNRSQAEDFAPLTVRLAVIDGWEHNAGTAGGENCAPVFCVVDNGSEYPLKKFTFNGESFLYPYDPRWPDEPKLFLPSRYAVPEKLKVHGCPDGEGIFKLELRAGAHKNVLATFVVQRGTSMEPIVLEAMSDDTGESGRAVAEKRASGGNENADDETVYYEPHWKEPGDEVSRTDLLSTYRFIYQHSRLDIGLLDAFLDGEKDTPPNELNLTNILKDREVVIRDWTGLQFLPSITINIEKDDSDINPIVCARLLNECLWRSITHPRMRTNRSINIITGGFHSSPEDYIEYMKRQQKEAYRQVADTAISMTELYLLPVETASVGTSMMVAIGEVADKNYIAIAGCVPVVPTKIIRKGAKILFHTKNAVVVLDKGEHIEAIKTAKTLATYGERYDTLKAAGIHDHIIAMLVLGGEIEVAKSRQVLANRLKRISPPPKNGRYHAHHDLPWEFRKEFGAFGLDVNDAQYGRWVHINDHQNWHFRKNGNRPTFNEHWRNFLYDEKGKLKNLNRDVILAELERVKEIYLPTQ